MSEIERKKIGEIAEVNPESFDPARYEQENAPYISLSCVSSGALVDIESINVNDPPSRAKRTVREGDILLGKVRPKQESHYKVTPEENGYVASSGFVVLRPKDVTSEYLINEILSDDFYSQMEAWATGNSYPSVNTSEVELMEISVPPRDEQERIASVLYTVDSKVEVLNERYDKLTRLKQALMQDLLTGQTRVTPDMEVTEEIVENPSSVDKYKDGWESVDIEGEIGKASDSEAGYARPNWSGLELPDGWESNSISDNCEIQGGKAFSGDRFSKRYNETDSPLIKRATVNNNRYPEEFLEGDFDEKYKVTKGDILVSMDGHFKSMLWRFEDAALNQRVCTLYPDTDVFNNWFLSYAIKRPLKYTEDSTGATTVKSLSINDFDYIDLPTPPLWEQERIASVLYTVDEMISKTDELIDKYEDLKRGLMQDLLSGDVRTTEDLEVLEEITKS